MASILPLLVLNAWLIPFSVLAGGNTTPGLSFHPRYEDNTSELIWVTDTGKTNATYWAQKLDTFLRGYITPGLVPGGGQNQVICDYGHPPAPGKVCAVDVRPWSPCNHENNYSYHQRRLCVFLRLDKIFGWSPEFHNNTNNLPNLMPQDLKHSIVELGKYNPKALNTVWVSCEGVHPADMENIGPIQYIPHRGFPGYYFPFMNTEGYASPLVAVLFERPISGVMINVKCKAWARNINNDPIEGHGTVRFELLVD